MIVIRKIALWIVLGVTAWAVVLGFGVDLLAAVPL